MTTRRWMIAAAVVGLTIASAKSIARLQARRAFYLERAAAWEDRVAGWTSGCGYCLREEYDTPEMSAKLQQ